MKSFPQIPQRQQTPPPVPVVQKEDRITVQDLESNSSFLKIGLRVGDKKPSQEELEIMLNALVNAEKEKSENLKVIKEAAEEEAKKEPVQEPVLQDKTVVPVLPVSDEYKEADPVFSTLAAERAAENQKNENTIATELMAKASFLVDNGIPRMKKGLALKYISKQASLFALGRRFVKNDVYTPKDNAEYELLMATKCFLIEE